jgi:hypothetical protein
MLLGALLGLHFVTRFHAQQVTPLDERHFYPESYFVSLSLMHGTGFRYLLPAPTPDAPLAPQGAASMVPPSRTGDPAGPVVGFLQLAGYERVSARQWRDYLAGGTRLAEAAPAESTRTLDLWATAVLWKLFGINWSVFFAFYAAVSTAAGLGLYLIARRVSGSYWCGLAAAFGFFASPLELYSGTWSTRDTVPLWATVLAFAGLAWLAGAGRSLLRLATMSFVAGAASLVGLGWRPDAMLVPPFIFGSLLLILFWQHRGTGEIAAAAAAFLGGCFAVILLIRALGPASYSQEGVVFHIAWYGESARSNLLLTENPFQVVRDDDLVVRQANYFALGDPDVADHTPSLRPGDPRHHLRCRRMYLALACYQALSWWRVFPGYLGRLLRADAPALLASEDEAAAFRTRRAGPLTPEHRDWLDTYGGILPWLVGLGAVGGLASTRCRVWTIVFALYLVYYAAATLLVLPESKHMAPLLVPLHVLGALGLWSLAKAVPGWRHLRWPSRLQFPAAVALLIVLAWGVLGVVAGTVSRRERSLVVDAVLGAARADPRPETLARTKLFTVRWSPEWRDAPPGYLLRIRAERPSVLFCVHVREPWAGEPFLAYYTRHAVDPGDRFFFFNIVSGRDPGDCRPYAAHIRLVGPAEIIATRALRLPAGPLGLPLGFVFDGRSLSASGPFLTTTGPATGSLPTPAEVGHLLSEPKAFLLPFRWRW